jgi:hypothetical protein
MGAAGTNQRFEHSQDMAQNRRPTTVPCPRGPTRVNLTHTYLRAHDPCPPANLSVLPPADEARPRNLENGFSAVPFSLSALQSHNHKAAERGLASHSQVSAPYSASCRIVVM